MNEDVEIILETASEQMDNAVKHLDEVLKTIRAGKASTQMVQGVTVDYYGAMMPIGQVANLSTSDARTIAIQPWERSMIPVIEKAIMAANLGFNPENNGEIIRINVPPLTEQRRKDLVKQVKQEGETAKVSIRNSRRDANEELKKLKKDGLAEDLVKTAEEDVQKLTDKHIVLVDQQLEKKEKDIVTL